MIEKETIANIIDDHGIAWSSAFDSSLDVPDCFLGRASLGLFRGTALM